MRQNNKFKVKHTKNQWRWLTEIPLSDGHNISIKSVKWSVTGKWIPASVIVPAGLRIMKTPQLIEYMEALALAGKWAMEMDSQHQPLGPIDIEG